MNNRLAITVLGSGTCVPDLEKSACAVLMETGNSRRQRQITLARDLMKIHLPGGDVTWPK
ncbi:MAG: hypothetical protein ACLFUY_05840 [Desulfobacterales bacterium]